MLDGWWGTALFLSGAWEPPDTREGEDNPPPDVEHSTPRAKPRGRKQPRKEEKKEKMEKML